MIDRRRFLGVTAGVGASLALTPELLRALRLSGVTPELLHPGQQPGGKLIRRAIPSSGEMLPVIGLGFADHASCADPAALKEVLKTFYDNGGRVFDTEQTSSPASEQLPATLATELGIQDKLFWGLKGYAGRSGPLTDPALAKAQVETLLARLKVSKLDLVQLPPAAGPEYWVAMKEAKKEGRIRYLGASITSFGPFPRFEAIMRNEPIDFISVDYCIDRRDAEEKILPLAMERRIAVLVIFPFGGANGVSCTGGRGLFARVGNTPLPEWAAEFDAKTWAQFFLKYVISHPAVTAVRTGTTKVNHILDNIGGGIGRLPDEAMRKRMAEVIDAIPLAVPPQALDRYVGEYRAPSGLTATFRRDGDTLFVKSGTSPEMPLFAITTRRFTNRQGSIFEFQMSGVGPATRVTGAVLEQGGQKTLLERN